MAPSITSLTSAALGLLLLQPVSAGMVIYLGASHDGVPGEGTMGGAVNSVNSEAIFYNEKPKEGCDGTGQVMVINGYNDNTMTDQGWVCDGCGTDDATEDDGNDYPTRFEVRDDDGEVIDGGGWFTLYKDEDAHTYGMIDDDGNRVGSCESPSDRDSVTCAHAVFGIDSAKMYWTCDTDWSIVETTDGF